MYDAPKACHFSAFFHKTIEQLDAEERERLAYRWHIAELVREAGITNMVNLSSFDAAIIQKIIDEENAKRTDGLRIELDVEPTAA